MIPLHQYDPPKVGPYTLRARLGEDAVTRTYLATAANKVPVALKVARPGPAADPVFREAFTHLVRGARNAQSPYVAAVLDADTEGPAPWAAVTRPEGPTLAECVYAHGPLPTAALPPLALALAQGLADLHSGARVHGSLRPEEALLTEPGAALADAGFEQAAARTSRPPARAPHSAPEGGLSPAADVHCWAATLCFAASGVEGVGGVEAVPMQMRGLVDACLQQEAELRPTSADIVRILGGPASPGPWPPEVVQVIRGHGERVRAHLAESAHEQKPRNRRRAVVLAAGGLSLALVAGSGAVWAFSNGPGSGDGEADEGVPAMISDTDCADADSLPEPGETIEDLDATDVSFSPDGSALLVTSYEHGLSVWDWQEGTEIARPADGSHPDYTAAFAPVGCMVAGLDPVEFRDTGYDYPVLNTHDLPSSETTEHLGPQTQRVLDELETPRRAVAFDFAPSGTHLAIAVGFESGTEEGSRQPTVGIIDMDDGELVQEWGEDINVWDLAHVDDDRLVIATGEELQVHDIESGEVLSTIRDYTGTGFGVVPGTGEIVYPSNDNLVRWDPGEETEVDRYPVPEFAEAAGDRGFVTDVEADPELGLLHFSWADPQQGQPTAGENVIDNDRLFPNEGRLWDMESGEELSESDASLTRPVAFHPEGDVIASINAEGGVELLDPASLDEISALP